jgi:hypothetical protein
MEEMKKTKNPIHPVKPKIPEAIPKIKETKIRLFV